MTPAQLLFRADNSQPCCGRSVFGVRTVFHVFHITGLPCR